LILFKQLPPEAIERIGDIDRSEHIGLKYGYQNGELVRQVVDEECPAWNHDENHFFSVAAQIDHWKPMLDAGGTLIGALDGERLAGFAVLRYRLTDDTAQLAAMYVSKDFRRQGIAERLLSEVVRLAKADHAQVLYVSATPSGSAVGFYLSQGFQTTNKPHAELLALEPEDIHMVKPL
jgi:ribosomal protein S18 acetylase RimI-like enzyme